MRRLWSIVAAIGIGALIVGALLYFTLKSSPSGKDASGVYQGVTAEWCSAHDGSFVPNVPAGGGPDLGSCTVANSP